MAFGERALLRGGPRAATVTAVGELKLLVITRDLFLAAVAGGQRLQAQDSVRTWPLRDLLPSLPLFARLPRETLRRAVERFDVAEFDAATVLVRQGDAGDRFYVLLAGSAEVTVNGRPVGRLASGDGFGEIALLHDVPRRATVTACEPVRVAMLDRAEFAKLVDGAAAPVAA
jgi:CRP-like cAMP-binding protein